MKPDPSMDRFAGSRMRSRQQMDSARTGRSTGPTACAPDMHACQISLSRICLLTELSIRQSLSASPPSPPDPPIPPSHHSSRHTRIETTYAIYAPRPSSRKPPGRSPSSGTRQSGGRSAASGRRYAVAAGRLCSGMRQRCQSPRQCPPLMPSLG